MTGSLRLAWAHRASRIGTGNCRSADEREESKLAGVTLVDPGRLGPGVYFVDQYANTANTVTFGQGIISHQVAGEWWRYAAWYGPDRRVRVGRQPSGGGWEIVALPMSLQRDDSHNCISLGISAADGRLHVCAGAHGAAMAYTRTVAGAVDDVPAWRATLFATPTDTLAGVAIGNMTYPVFTGKPDGGLLFWYRNGGPSNGRARLAEYDGTWRLLGDVTRSTGTWTAWNGATSTSRYLYSPAPQYDGTRLHLVGTWRESNPAVLCAPNTIANHHVVHVYSDDHGRTWRNGAGTQVAATGVDPLSVNDPGILADSNTDTRYALQVPSLAVGRPGSSGIWATMSGVACCRTAASTTKPSASGRPASTPGGATPRGGTTARSLSPARTCSASTRPGGPAGGISCSVRMGTCTCCTRGCGSTRPPHRTTTTGR